MDGDLGPHDVLRPRLGRADTVVVLDLSFARCAWRAWRRGSERADFWRWLFTWRYRSRPAVLRHRDRTVRFGTVGWEVWVRRFEWR